MLVKRRRRRIVRVRVACVGNAGTDPVAIGAVYPMTVLPGRRYSYELRRTADARYGEQGCALRRESGAANATRKS